MSASPSVVAVAFPTAVSGLYDYAIPQQLRGKVTAGAPVLVDLNNRKMWGMAVRLLQESSYPKLKEVLEVKQVMDADTFGAHTELYEWIASYYQCSLGAVFRPFVRKGLLHTEAKRQTRYRFTGYLPDNLTRRQREAAESLSGQTTPLTRREITETFGVSDHMVTVLTRSGVLHATSDEIVREADELRMQRHTEAVTLTTEQRQAVDTLKASFDSPPRPFLLHGITGSGKTHVYIELVRYALERGRAAIVLVPEISLTPQTIQRFAGALGDTIAVIHSHMSDGERRDSLEELVSGRKRVVIGVRSAILAPLPSLGLIIVDEEHDGSYKQSDTDPRYHARDVAVMRGRLQKALVVLGSATPSLESYHNAQSGKYELIRLAERFGRATLPRVSVVDMADERRSKNWTFVSKYLEYRLAETLHAKRQAILLLNRRGFSTFLICKDCGETYACPNCSVKLVYHRAEGSLRCHQCGHFENAPTVCPACRGEQLQYKGTAIQKAEEHLRTLFPAAAIRRMDQDTTRNKGAHVAILEAVARREVDILLGTQMVSKGLDFPGVALVGVLQADIGLHIPDFRASERTFQLLTQVAGRAGRTDDLGEVIIQTNLPEDSSIMMAQTHDYLGFAEKELPARLELAYPPFCRLARIVVSGPRREDVHEMAHAAADALNGLRIAGLSVLGPAPAILERVKSKYRYSLLLKSRSAATLGTALTRLRQAALPRKRDTRLAVDVDPVSML